MGPQDTAETEGKSWELMNFDEKLDQLKKGIETLVESLREHRARMEEIHEELSSHKHDENGVAYLKKTIGTKSLYGLSGELFKSHF